MGPRKGGVSFAGGELVAEHRLMFALARLVRARLEVAVETSERVGLVNRFV